jgi:hypothetical protein
VQRQLVGNQSARASGGGRAAHPSLLAGLLFDQTGEPLTATHAVKAGKRYRYYVSRRLITGTREASPGGWRVPAGEVEQVAADRLRQFLGDPSALLRAFAGAEAPPPGEAQDEQALLPQAAVRLAQRWSDLDPAERRRIVRTVLTRVELRSERVDVHVSPAELRALLLGGRALPDGAAAPVTGAASIVLPIAAKFERAGKAMALVAAAGTAAATRPDAALIRLVARGRALRDALAATDAASITAFARREGLSKSYVTRLARLAYLAPDIVTAIVEGRQPAGLTATRLLEDTRLPLDWQEQRRALGFA